MQPDAFAERADPATLPEWMDEPATDADMRACLRDLAQVNVLTLAHRPTLRWLRGVVATHSAAAPLRILDVGCGGGDMLRRIARWSARRHVPVELTGIDLNPQVIRIAQEFSRRTPGIRWIAGDVYQYAEPVDIVVCSLLTHHLRDDELTRFLAWMEAHAARGWFINDLYRSARAHGLFSLLAKVMRWHRFVQHDGPVSIRRSFREADWQRLGTAAGLPLAEVRIAKAFPSRLCVGRVR